MLFDRESYHGLDISKKYIDYARKKYDRKLELAGENWTET
jgi:hypothetical protein